MKLITKKWVSVFLAAMVLGIIYTVVPSQTADEIKQQKKELEKLKSELEKDRKAAKQLKYKEKNALKNLKRMDQRIQAINRQLRSLKKKEADVENAILAKETDLKAKSGQLAILQQQFGARVREIYKRTQVRDLEWLLTADSFTSFLRNLKYLNRVAQQNRNKYLDIVKRKQKIEQDKVALEDNLEKQQQIQQDKEKLGVKYQAQRKDRQKVLGRIRSKRSLFEEAVKEKENQYKAMQALIERLERARNKGAGPMGATRFGKARGLLQWPVKGRIVSRFGKQFHPKYKGVVTYNKGIDIRARAGDPVKSVWKGRVVMVDWIRGYGKFIIVDHGEGYYAVYAHLSEILTDKGDEVMAGELIGRAGDTGSIKGTVLHFELRKGKEALDPAKWLRK